MSNTKFSFKNKKKYIEIDIELEEETLERVKISPLTVSRYSIIENESISNYYKRIVLNMLRKNKNYEEIALKLLDNLEIEEISEVINNSAEELQGKFKTKD